MAKAASIANTAVQSMTGFGTASEQIGSFLVTCDAKSVNGKSLDVRLRTPSVIDKIEPAVRKYVSETINRGNLQIAIGIERVDGEPAIAIDEALFKKLAAQTVALAKQNDLAPPSADALLNLRGVITSQGELAQSGGGEELEKTAFEVVQRALAELSQMRLHEGAQILQTMQTHLDTMSALVDAAHRQADAAQSAIAERLKDQLANLLAGTDDAKLDTQRLNAEIAVLATKADIREELDRLRAHIKAAADLLRTGGQIGRKLEFLCQEFNREANTLCSKSASIALTETGLSMKATIDQMREQAANIA